MKKDKHDVIWLGVFEKLILWNKEKMRSGSSIILQGIMERV